MTIAIAAALALAGCQSQEGPVIATAEQPNAGPSAPGTTAPATQEPKPLSDYDKALRYTRCMTDNGAPHADPVVGEPLLTHLNVVDLNGEVVSGDMMERRRESHEKCKKYLPATWPVKIDPKEVARSALFSKCMDEQDVGFPMVGKDGMIAEPTDGKYERTPEYRAAESKCRRYYDDGANNQPENR